MFVSKRDLERGNHRSRSGLSYSLIVSVDSLMNVLEPVFKGVPTQAMVYNNLGVHVNACCQAPRGHRPVTPLLCIESTR